MMKNELTKELADEINKVLENKANFCEHYVYEETSDGKYYGIVVENSKVYMTNNTKGDYLKVKSLSDLNNPIFLLLYCIIILLYERKEETYFNKSTR